MGIMKALISFILLLGLGTAWAIPVTWTLDNVGLSDGTNINGSFSYDADTNTYTDILIETDATESTIYPGAFFSEGALYEGDYDDIAYVSQPSDAGNLNLEEGVFYFGCGTAWCDLHTLELVFTSQLTNSGGAIGLDTSSREGAHTAGYTAYRNVVSGSVIGTVVPIPAAVWLFGSAFAALAYARRRIVAP